MSDFQDFLKRQYAYVAIGEFKPGKFNEMRHLYEEAVGTYGQGFKGAYLLQEPGTDRGISVIFWESIEDMEANHTQVYDQILAQMSPLFVSPPATHTYELVCAIDPAHADDSKV
ncbi:antibiotic biosynthesis monooxygenase [Synechococcales cyanobacterium C]|uniref:Antibiotic biosynthesis monooxygenase n=1 Tax=Petrachloros mirabilis ULC683 TaxID=2781853 RepID=A0A8K2A877_9CYAN|nr:antibiotic biosynthesis monooxygenase [Petrachloros mirabilis]NCJ07701.1 antibiotic biosynthesis monooxygenase [Petrachloros mirabilis ULC683]